MSLEICNVVDDVELLNYFQLTLEERKELSKYDSIDESSFFRYRDYVYDVADFMRINHGADGLMKGYDGYHGDTFFSGVLIKYNESSDGVKVAMYYSK